jgi:ATP-dependent DNA helicase RecG
MAKTSEYKLISAVAKKLLSKEETFDVEFKKNANNLNGEDFAAFANSDTGGTILIGVDEIKDAKGRQKGKVVGCPVGDKQKLALLSKAGQCVPPVPIVIYVENSATNPFYRVLIPSGINKPYCSSGGTYKIRRDGNTQPLQPHDLLRIFMHVESGKFLSKFKESTIELRREIQDQNDSLVSAVVHTNSGLLDEMTSISTYFGQAQEAIHLSLHGIVREIEDDKSEREDSYFDIKSGLDDTNGNILNLAKKLNHILASMGLEDPEITKIRTDVTRWVSVRKATIKEAGGRTSKGGVLEFHSTLKEMNKLLAEWYDFDEFYKWYKSVPAHVG